MCTYKFSCSFMHSPLFIVSPCVFLFFAVAVMYTEMKNDSCSVQIYFPLSLATEFRSSDFGYAWILSLVVFFFPDFSCSQGKKKKLLASFSFQLLTT